MSPRTLSERPGYWAFVTSIRVVKDAFLCPAGDTYLVNLRQEVDAGEATTMYNIKKSDYDNCKRAGHGICYIQVHRHDEEDGRTYHSIFTYRLDRIEEMRVVLFEAILQRAGRFSPRYGPPAAALSLDIPEPS